MDIDIKPGKYVVAVSGGVDSVALLHMLTKQTGLELVVAHFDHGLRPDSKEDREFVAKLSQKYRLSFEYEEGNLGKAVSENTARKARYSFLQRVRKKYDAQAILMAHHQDDVIETMFINLLRGTRQKGLVSLANTKHIQRPLLNFSKQDVIAYARTHNLEWHEDSTNQDTYYLRNWLRHDVLSKLSVAERTELLTLQAETAKTSREIEQVLAAMGASEHTVDKKLLAALPHDVAQEYVAQWLRNNGIRDFDARTIERVVVGAKTLATHKVIEVKNGYQIQINDKKLRLHKASVAKRRQSLV